MHTVTLNINKQQLVLTHPNVSKLMTYDFSEAFDKCWNKMLRKKALLPDWYDLVIAEFRKLIEAEGFRDTNQRTVNLI